MASHDAKSRLEAQDWKLRSLPGFIEVAGPLWTRREQDGWAYGVFCEACHLNPAGRVHGGALLTLLDHAISTVAWEASARAPCVTVQLSTQFLGAVEAGQFAEARARVVRKTGSLLFLDGAVVVDGGLVVSAQAVLKALGAK